MEKLNELEDPRSPSNGTRHDFREILVIAVCAILKAHVEKGDMVDVMNLAAMIYVREIADAQGA